MLKSELISHFENEFQVKIQPCTTSRILNKYAPSILKLDNISDDKYRMKSAKYPQLEDATTTFIEYTNICK